MQLNDVHEVALVGVKFGSFNAIWGQVLDKSGYFQEMLAFSSKIWLFYVFIRDKNVHVQGQVWVKVAIFKNWWLFQVKFGFFNVLLGTRVRSVYLCWRK